MNLAPLTSWLEDGAPVVSAELAQARGTICSTCPLNITANWWERLSKEPIAEVIKKWIEIKDNARIGVPIEKELGVCNVCGCVLRLKCHEPIKYISEHTEESMMKEFPDYCWITKENKS